jgi:hypothetical protein
MAEARRAGLEYRTRLDPPPGDPSVAHGASRGARTTRAPPPRDATARAPRTCPNRSLAAARAGAPRCCPTPG